MKKKVLVTGANGQLGLTFKELFEKNSKSCEFTFMSKANLDISNTDDLKRVFESDKYDYCINCAAYTNVDQAEIEQEKAFNINAEAVKILAENCKTRNTTLIHISTDYVFDGEQEDPYKESENTNPINIYGESKLRGERYIQEITNNYYVIRASWLYSKYNKNFVKTIVNKLQENMNLQIITTQTGTPTSCIDLSNFIYFLINNNVDYGVYHFSALGQANWYEFAQHIASSFNHDLISNIKPVTNFVALAKRPKYSVLNNTKTQQIPYRQNHWKTSVNRILKDLVNKD
ncbi:dTDP-4-dehydrorhamnose reductase [Oceanihabitans sp.]|nr:dTDP-4-dehydrorhamnose reductase [Oceanihabitans sp.]